MKCPELQRTLMFPNPHLHRGGIGLRVNIQNNFIFVINCMNVHIYTQKFMFTNATYRMGMGVNLQK